MLVDKNTTPPLKLYQMMFKILNPYEGTITVAAPDVDTAREYLSKMFEGRSLEIISAVDTDLIEGFHEMASELNYLREVVKAQRDNINNKVVN